MLHLSYMLLGLSVGIFSGFMGLGGGIILIPALIYIFGLTQHQAQGTSLAIMVPPITLLAAIKYYQSGNVKLNMTIFIALGFVVGGLLGADIVRNIPDIILRKIFGFIMLVVALRMIIFS